MASQLLRDGLWASKKLRRCSFLAHTIYPYVYLVADQWGRFEWDPEVLQARLFGVRLQEVPSGYLVGTDSVPCGYLLGLLFEYERNGLLERYAVGEKVCARWTGYQGLPESKRAKSKLPEPEKGQVLRLPDGSDTVPRWYREGTDSVRTGSLVEGVVSGLVEGLVEGEELSAPPAPKLCPGCGRTDTLVATTTVSGWQCLEGRGGCGRQLDPDDPGITSQLQEPEKPLPKKQGPAEQVFEHWQRVMAHPTAKFTKERRAKVKARLSEGYTVEQLKAAVDGCRASPHHRGQNDAGAVYDDLELICRNGGKVESFVAKQPVPEPAPVEEKWTPEDRAEALAERDRRLAEMRDRAKRGREEDDGA